MSSEIRVLNCLHDLRDSSRSIAEMERIMPHGETLGFEPEYLRDAVWPRSRG